MMTPRKPSPVTTLHLSAHPTLIATPGQSGTTACRGTGHYNSVAKFGEWIMGEEWDCISGDLSASQQARIFEQFTLNKLDHYCPEQVIKISSQDSPWINKEEGRG